MVIKGNKNISVKEINKINILGLVMDSGPISRVDISKLLNISRPAVTEHVRGLIEESGKSSSTPFGGKKAVLLKIHAEAGYILAVMIGVKTIRAALTDLNSRIIKITKAPTEEWKGPENVMEKIVKNIHVLIQWSDNPFEKVIGIGVFLTHEMLVGSKGIAGEAGHLITHISSKKSCHCGNIGCLETLCSMNGLFEDTKKSFQEKPGPETPDIESLTIEDLYGLYDAGNEAVVRNVEKNAEDLGIGISNVIKIFDPEIVIIHGGAIRFRQRHLDRARKTVKKNTFPMAGQEYDIEFPGLDENVVLMEASCLVFENIFNRDDAAFSGRHIVKRKATA